MRVLVVCFTESTHSQSWIDLFGDDNEFDVRVFAHNLAAEGLYLPQEWKKPTYVLEHPTIPRENAEIISLFPNLRYAKFISARISTRLSLADWYLRKVIDKWKPDIVHSLSLLPAGYFTWQALSKVKINRPLFVVSSWGSDINLGKDDAGDKLKIQEVLNNCDGFIADCERDIGNALNLGLPKESLAFDFAVPVTGGIDIYKNTDVLPVEKRNVILLPKAFEGFNNKILPVLEALNILRDKLEGFEVHLLLASEEVKKYLALMPEAFKKYCYVHSQLPGNEVLDLMKRSRVMVAPSISDGTPSTLLEAMSVGALPLVSPLESIKEWIEDGKNGLLAHALYPDKIVKALDRALTDDELFNSASIINREIIEKRADRRQIQPQVMNYYKRLLDGKRRKLHLP
ncbi:MAG TPA: glycosyltransferase [Pyrinomonadaceae bacterium]|nr:glycosyltransferase [Pyrinomonadaceae bacterium]